MNQLIKFGYLAQAAHPHNLVKTFITCPIYQSTTSITVSASCALNTLESTWLLWFFHHEIIKNLEITCFIFVKILQKILKHLLYFYLTFLIKYSVYIIKMQQSHFLRSIFIKLKRLHGIKFIFKDIYISIWDFGTITILVLVLKSPKSFHN